MGTLKWYKRDHVGPVYLYLVQAMTDADVHPIKVGISKNVKQRMRALASYGVITPRLLGTYEFPDYKSAFAVEQMAVREFPRTSLRFLTSHEILDVKANDLIAFVSQHAPTKFVSARVPV